MIWAKELETKNRKTRSQAGNRGAAILALFLSLSLIIALNPNFADSATVDDLKREQEQKQQRLTELSNQIKSQQQEINRLVQQTNTLQNQIAIFTAQINQLTTQVVITQTKIEV